MWRRQWQPTPVVLPGKSHGQRSLVGCSPWGRWELDTTEQLHFHFSLSCIGEGNGNLLQCSCLENPRDRGAWWAAVYGVAQSRTRLKWLSSGSSNPIHEGSTSWPNHLPRASPSNTIAWRLGFQHVNFERTQTLIWLHVYVWLVCKSTYCCRSV